MASQLNWTSDGQAASRLSPRSSPIRIEVWVGLRSSQNRGSLPPAWILVQPEMKYWASYKEAEAIPAPELMALLKEVFSR